MSPQGRPGFGRLADAYRQRGAALARAGGGGQVLVGHVGNTVPLELIRACGARTLRIAPTDGDPCRADALIEPFSDRDVRLVFADYLAGAYDGLDLLVVPRSSESWHKLYLALREAVRIGHKAGGPALWLHDVPHTQRASSRAYGLARTQDLADQVAQRSGQACTPDALRAAVRQSNAVRHWLSRLQTLRGQGRVSGWAAQVATGATWFMAPDEASSALAEWLEGPPPPVQRGPRLFVQGAALDHAELHALVDACGGVVVQEDDDWGSRAAAPLIDEAADPFGAVFDHYWRDVPCPRIHPPAPGPSGFAVAWRARAIDGVLFNLARPDDVHGWRWPSQRTEADALGLPWLVLRDDARDPEAQPALRAALQDFIGRCRRATT